MTATKVLRGPRAGLLILPFLLAGCAVGRPMTPPQSCPPACRVDISLPPSNGGQPGIPHEQLTTRAQPGSRIDFGLPRTSNRNRILLVFSEPALVDSDGRPLWTVGLRGRSNMFTVRDTANCPSPGCKYTVIDLDDPLSEPLDPWIIIER